MNISRILTPQVVSVLFQTKDPEDVQKTVEILNDLVIETQTNLAKSYLLEKGIAEEEIDNYFKEVSSDNSQIREILASEEMARNYTDTYNMLIESIYNQQLSKLNDSEKAQLEAALKLENDASQVELTGLEVDKASYEAVQALKNSGQVSEDQIREALGKAYDEKFGEENINQEQQPVTEEITDAPVSEVVNDQHPSVETPVVENSPAQIPQEESEAPDQPNI